MKFSVNGTHGAARPRQALWLALLLVTVCMAAPSRAGATDADPDAAPPKSPIRIIPVPPADSATPMVVPAPIEANPVEASAPSDPVVVEPRPVHYRHSHWRSARRTWPRYGDPHDGCTPWSVTHGGLGRAYVC